MGPTRLRILYSFPGTIGAAGVGWTAWNQVNELVRGGHEVHLVAAKLATPIDGLASVALSLTLGPVQVPHRVLGHLQSFAWHDHVAARAARRLRPDVVHIWPGSSMATIAVARGLHVPAVRECPNTHTEHAYQVVAQEYAKLGLTPPEGASHTRDEHRLAVEQREWASATALLVPSEVVAQSFVANGVAASRLLRHQYGCTIDRPAERDDSDRPFTAIFLGRGEPRKGLHYALRAWQQSVAKQGGRFLIYGDLDPAYLKHLGDLLDQPGVQMAGFTSDPVAALLESDVLLLPTVEEGSALVTYEAQVTGCVPLVSTAAGAMLTDGVEGLVHEVGDVATLSQHLDLLYGNPAELARLRHNALQHAPQLSWTAASERLVAAYRNAIDRVGEPWRELQPRDISILLCTRDRPAMLAEALASIRRSCHPDLEVIVIDSASREDDTQRVTEAAGYRYVRSDIPGLSIARNVGLASSTRPIVVYTDDDCEAAPGWDTVLLRHFRRPNAGAVTGDMRHHGEPIQAGRARTFTTPAKGLDAGHGAIMAFRRDLLLQLGGFDEVLGAGRRLAGAEDLDMFCRVIAAGSIVINDPECVVVHMNTRDEEDFAKLMRGYGLGLGALGNKWLRTRPAVGVRMNAMMARRALHQLARDRGDQRGRRGATALIKGYLSGFGAGSRMSLQDLRFVDDVPPAPIQVSAGGGE